MITDPLDNSLFAFIPLWDRRNAVEPGWMTRSEIGFRVKKVFKSRKIARYKENSDLATSSELPQPPHLFHTNYPNTSFLLESFSLVFIYILKNLVSSGMHMEMEVRDTCSFFIQKAT